MGHTHGTPPLVASNVAFRNDVLQTEAPPLTERHRKANGASAVVDSYCPACERKHASMSFLESHFDPIAQKRYNLIRCEDCSVVSSQPRETADASWYAKHAFNRPLMENAAGDVRFSRFLRSQLPPGRILDMGCGDGAFLALAAQQGFTPTGFDYDERATRLAQSRGLTDVHTMEFFDFCASRNPGEFDVVTMFDAMEHTPEPAQLMDQVRRLVRIGGHVAITLPNDQRPLLWGREEWDYPPNHFTRWSPKAISGFLEQRGFEIVEQDADLLLPRYFTNHCFNRAVLPALRAVARRILFGRAAEITPASFSTLVASAESEPVTLVSDASKRAKAIGAVRTGFTALFALADAGLRAYYQRQPKAGVLLYTLARRVA